VESQRSAEIGYLPMTREQANLFFQVIAARYERGRGSLLSSALTTSGKGPEVTVLARNFCFRQD
jgi:hypothetical protein